MSVDVYVNARKKILPGERELLEAYNMFLDNDIAISNQHKLRIVEILDREPENGWGEPIALDYREYIEHHITGVGDVMYHDGMIIRLKDLPPGTVELRVFAQA